MKVLSFSELRFVRAILEGRKNQTIRPLMCSNCKGEGYFMHLSSGSLYRHREYNPRRCIKCDGKGFRRPRIAEGEKAVLVYRQRSKNQFFCLKCGEGGGWFDFPHKEDCIFPRVLMKKFATALITEAFEVEIGADTIFTFKRHKTEKSWLEDFSLRDGFESPSALFKWFSQHYELSKPKRFAVYRFRLVRDEKV
jgi:hypothetical protein